MTKELMIKCIVEAAKQGASPENIRALCDVLYAQWQRTEAARSAEAGSEPRDTDREPDNQG